jgi:HAMP domain-containing protein
MLVAVLATGMAGATVPAAATAASTAREVAAALRSDPVFVDESQSGLLTVPQRGDLRLRIVDVDIGRIQIAVVAQESVERAGGVGALANAVDQAMPGRRGSLLVTNGSAFHVVTSHAVVNPTAAAVRAAVESHSSEGLDAQLLAAVDGIAEVDPGADSDLNVPPPAAPATPRPDDVGDDIGEGVRIGVLIVAAAIALPFLIGAIALFMALRRSRSAARTRERLDEGDARGELVALGEELQALDIDVDMPNASPRGREEYERALNLYDRANRLLLKDDPSEVELYEARRSIEEGRTRLAAARDALSTGQT